MSEFFKEHQKALVRRKIEVFEKLTSACFIQISQETILLRINNIHKNVRDNCSLTYVYSYNRSLHNANSLKISLN